MKAFRGMQVETLVLVAVWERPFIFQGCFQLQDLDSSENKVCFFFRCESSYQQQNDLFEETFLAQAYEFTLLYDENGVKILDKLQGLQESASYLLKYALHVTLKEMLSNQKLHFTSIDDVALQAIISKVEPILKREAPLPEEEHIGFAVAMDFCPTEERGRAAALALLDL